MTSIVYLAPVDPTRLTFGQRSDDATIASKRAELGLDQPLFTQWVYYMRDISPVNLISSEHKILEKYNYLKILEARGRMLLLKEPYLRRSYQSDRSVASMLAEALPLTFLLAMAAFLIATIFGLLLGLIAALCHNSLLDQFIVGISTVGYAIPSYVSAIFIALFFAYYLGDWTHLNIQGSLIELNDIGDYVWRWENLILPAIALGIRPISVITQLSRSAYLDVLSNDYVRTAKAKGLDFIQTFKKHVLRNAMNPIVTSLSGWLASLFAGAFFVESVFNYKGLGLMTIQALINYDIPVLLACISVVSLLFVLINLAVDLIYLWIDPSIKLF